jgi:hypothetical protein
MTMTKEKSTTKKPLPARKGVATATTPAATRAKTSKVSKAAPVAGEEKTPRTRAVRIKAADTEPRKPAPSRRGTTAARKAQAKPSAEQRYRMIQSAAYFLAEKEGFQGSATHYWAVAEREIAAQLGESESQG